MFATLPSRNPNLSPDIDEEVLGEQFNVEIPGLVLRAARMPEIRILRGFLRHGFAATNYIVGPLNHPWESTLANSIQARLPEHSKLLFEHGANPNNSPDRPFLAASTRFIRSRDAVPHLPRVAI